MNCCLCQNQFVPGVQRVGTWRSEENSVIKGEDQGTGNSSSREGMPGNILRHFLLSHSALPSPLHSALLHQYLNTWNRVPQNCCFFFLFSSAGHLMIMLLVQKTYTLREEPFLHAPHCWEHFARKNVCDSATEIPY